MLAIILQCILLKLCTFLSFPLRTNLFVSSSCIPLPPICFLHIKAYKFELKGKHNQRITEEEYVTTWEFSLPGASIQTDIHNNHSEGDWGFQFMKLRSSIGPLFSIHTLLTILSNSSFKKAKKALDEQIRQIRNYLPWIVMVTAFFFPQFTTTIQYKQ